MDLQAQEQSAPFLHMIEAGCMFKTETWCLPVMKRLQPCSALSNANCCSGDNCGEGSTTDAVGTSSA